LLAADGARVVAGTADQVALSDDGGQGWTILRRELPPVTAVALLSSPGG
jgi:hypothetical protein